MNSDYITLIPPKPPVRYFRGPLPDPYDSHVTAYVRAFRDLSAERRAEVIGTLVQPERAVLKDFARRAPSLAVRSRLAAFIEDGVTALAISDFVDDLANDPLSDYISLAVLRDAANRIGVDFNDILERIAAFASASGAGHVRGFKRNLATLEQMSYMCIDEPDGVRYLPDISGLPVGVTLRDFRINEVLAHGNDRAKGDPSQWSRTAHWWVSNQVLGLLHFDVFQEEATINIIESPTQYVIISESGPLQPLIEETYRWCDAADLAVAWEPIEEELMKKRTDMIIEHSPDYWSLPRWLDHFGHARGPSLCRPLYPAAFSHRLIVAYRASDGFWCQGYRGGVPEARPIRLKRESRVGMAVIGAFDRKWFPSLPMVWAEPRLVSPALIKMEWHPDDDLLSANLPLELELAKWL